MMAIIPNEGFDRVEKVLDPRGVIANPWEGDRDSCGAVFRESAGGHRHGKHRHGQ
jgi:hypothetical protein